LTGGKNKVLDVLQQGFILIELLLQEAITDEEIKHGGIGQKDGG
jgi:hypothetical protein